jgi:CheY-like chemotaxis protein
LLKKGDTVKTILIVDDQPMLRHLMDVALRGDGRRFLHAGSGEEAVEIATTERPDLVLLDIMMPGGMDGLEVTRQLKNDPRTAGCAIVAVTAKVQQTDQEKARDAGVDGYLTKPFSLAELREKVAPFV